MHEGVGGFRRLGWLAATKGAVAEEEGGAMRADDADGWVQHAGWLRSRRGETHSCVCDILSEAASHFGHWLIHYALRVVIFPICDRLWQLILDFSQVSDTHTGRDRDKIDSAERGAQITATHCCCVVEKTLIWDAFLSERKMKHYSILQTAKKNYWKYTRTLLIKYHWKAFNNQNTIIGLIFRNFLLLS